MDFDGNKILTLHLCILTDETCLPRKTIRIIIYIIAKFIKYRILSGGAVSVIQICGIHLEYRGHTHFQLRISHNLAESSTV